MAWRIVKQPDGKYARFSEVVDNFTHYDMTREEAVDLCCDHMGRHDAEVKVQNADNDLDSRNQKGDGLSRWRESLETIEIVHGKSEREKTETLFRAV